MIRIYDLNNSILRLSTLFIQKTTYLLILSLIITGEKKNPPHLHISQAHLLNTPTLAIFDSMHSANVLLIPSLFINQKKNSHHRCFQAQVALILQVWWGRDRGISDRTQKPYRFKFSTGIHSSVSNASSSSSSSHPKTDLGSYMSVEWN